MGALTTREVILGQVEDAFCPERLKKLEVLSAPDPKWSRQAFLCREKNRLLYRHSVYGRKTNVVIPEALKQRLLRYQHQSVLAGHPGSRRIYDTLRRYVYWPTMVVVVKEHVEQCPACAKNCLSERTHTFAMRLCPALETFSGLAMDLLGPLTTSRGVQKHVLVICDRFTKLTGAIPSRDATALTVSSAFIDTFVAAYGIPDSILTDNEPQFASAYYQRIPGYIFEPYLSLPPPDQRAGGTIKPHPGAAAPVLRRGASDRMGQSYVLPLYFVQYEGTREHWGNPNCLREPWKAPSYWRGAYAPA